MPPLDVAPDGLIQAICRQLSRRRILEQRRAYAARLERDNMDSQRRQLGAKRRAKGLNGRLGRVVDAEEAGPEDLVDAADIDDEGAVVVLRVGGGHEQRQKGLGDGKGAQDVDLEHSARGVDVGVGKGHNMHEPRIVDENVELAACRLGHVRSGGLDGRARRDVEDQCRDAQLA